MGKDGEIPSLNEILDRIIIINKMSDKIDRLIGEKNKQKEPTTEVSDADPTKEEGTTMAATRKTKEEKAVLSQLRTVAGKQFQDSNIVFKGTQLILPARWTTKRAIDTIFEYQEAMEQHTSFSRNYRYRPWDGAAAADRAIRILTGTSGVGKIIRSFFGDTPPMRITINVDVNETNSVPWGRLNIPLFEGDIDFGTHKDPEYGMLFRLTADVPKKYEAEVNGFFDLVQQELEERSIYKGKAFTGAEEPEFVDISSVDPEKVIYSDDVMEQMEAHLWSTLKYPEAMRAHGIPLKRSVLFHGPYGSGKTLGGMVTAQVAVENGWTFIICRPGKDNPFDVLQTAQLYAPSVVFIEDIDTYSRSTGMSRDTMSELLDKFDGIQAKGNDILNVMTTNHEESITKGMLRPGRLDALIEIAHLDLGGMTRMVHSMIPADKLDNVNFEEVFEVMEGYLPAFVSESVTRAQKASIVRGDGKLLPLNTADLRSGAMSLRAQYNLMTEASEVENPPTLDVVMRGLVTEGVKGLEVYSQNDEYTVGEIIEAN